MMPSNLTFEIIEIENMMAKLSIHDDIDSHDIQQCGMSESVEMEEVELKPEYQVANVSKSDEVYEMELKPGREVAKASENALGFSNLFYCRKWYKFYRTEPNTPKPPSKIRFDEKVKVKYLYDPKEDRKSDWRECVKRYREEKKRMKIKK